MNTKVRLNEKAGVFYDPSTGICIRKGQVVELSSTQMLAPRIARALRGGHLVTAIESTKEVTPLSGSELRKKFENLYNQGMTVSKVSKNFSMEELKAVAQEFNLEADANDTKKTLTEAIFEELAPVEGESEDGEAE